MTTSLFQNPRWPPLDIPIKVPPKSASLITNNMSRMSFSSYFYKINLSDMHNYQWLTSLFKNSRWPPLDMLIQEILNSVSLFGKNRRKCHLIHNIMNWICLICILSDWYHSLKIQDGHHHWRWSLKSLFSSLFLGNRNPNYNLFIVLEVSE